MDDYLREYPRTHIPTKHITTKTIAHADEAKEKQAFCESLDHINLKTSVGWDGNPSQKKEEIIWIQGNDYSGNIFSFISFMFTPPKTERLLDTF